MGLYHNRLKDRAKPVVDYRQVQFKMKTLGKLSIFHFKIFNMILNVQL